jgi:DNA polymerase-1
MPRLEEELEDVQGPVLALGKVATDALGMQNYDRGVVFDWGDRKASHTYHPAYLLRSPGDSKYLFADIERIVFGPPVINPEWLEPTVNHIQDVGVLAAFLKACPDDSWVAFDIETDQTRWYVDYFGKPGDPILMLQIAWDDPIWGLTNVVVDDVMLYDTPEAIPVLQKFFNRVRTVGHNGKFDQVFLKSHLGLDIHLDFDTMLAHYLLDENGEHGLKELTTEYFGIPDYEDRLIKQYLATRNDRYSKIPFEPFAKYGVIDVYMTLEFRKILGAKLEAQGRYDWPFQNIVMRASNAFVRMELRGIKIDVDYLMKVRDYMQSEMDRLASEACQIIGREPGQLNLQSPQQVAVVVYDELGFPEQKSRRLKPRSTNHAAIEAMQGKHPFIDKLLEYRRVAKMKQSYADNIYESLDQDGCVHTTFLQHRNEVGRLSARNPALQTIPRAESEKDNKGFWGAMIKACFVARPGKVIVDADYSQAELRVAAVLAMEPFLLDVYEHDRDLHTEVAVAMYGPGWTKEQRMRTKMFNFSYLYGGSEFSFAMDAGLPLKIAKDFVHNYNKVMPRLAQFRKDQFAFLDEHGYVESPFGRRRHIEIITKANEDDARKAAVHAPVAGTASDLTLLSGCQLEEEGFDVLLLVHDSILVEVDEDEAEEVWPYVKRVMEEKGQYHLPQVKWKADTKVRQRWADPPEVEMRVL